jgi:hypothetical protein
VLGARRTGRLADYLRGTPPGVISGLLLWVLAACLLAMPFIFVFCSPCGALINLSEAPRGLFGLLSQTWQADEKAPNQKTNIRYSPSVQEMKWDNLAPVLRGPTVASLETCHRPYAYFGDLRGLLPHG